MASYLYGITTTKGEHIDISATERAAKCYATRHGYKGVSRRNTISNLAESVSVRVKGRWVPTR